MPRAGRARAFLFFWAAAALSARVTVAALVTLLASGVASAQKEALEVTDAEIAKYKATARAGCTEAGMARSEPKEKVDAFCSCVIETLEKAMTRAEWQHAYFYAMNKRENDERQVLAPHLAKLGNCRPQ